MNRFLIRHEAVVQGVSQPSAGRRDSASQQAEAKAKGEADAAIKQAIGNKQAAITIAEGEAEAIRLVAEAQAEANDLIRTTLNDDLIKYTLTQEIGDDLRVVVVPSGADFILGSEIVGGAPQ